MKEFFNIYLILLIGKFVRYVSSFLRLGSGATWPGEIALRIDPNILPKLLKKIKKGIIIVAGTNGKTTTSLLLRNMLLDQGYTVLYNASGANLQNGIVSTFFQGTKSAYDFAVFEVDENALPIILSHLRARNYKLHIVLLNLFRDQLDRYGEVDAIAKKWIQSLIALETTAHIYINADDPQLVFIGKEIEKPVKNRSWNSFTSGNNRIYYFGLDNKKYYIPKVQHATDSIYCPACGSRLIYKGYYYSHLGDWSCTVCGLNHPNVHVRSDDVISPFEGVYNIYNTLAAVSVGKILNVDMLDIEESFASAAPAFGRLEEVTYKGKKVRILLSKNPTGFNESIRTMLASPNKGPLLLLLNDRIPDGTDVSWIWDVDFEILDQCNKPIVISGDRYLDMGVRMKYALSQIRNPNIEIRNKSKIPNNDQVHKRQKFVVENSLGEAVKQLVDNINENETGWVLATYSAMLDVRKILTGKSIL